MNPTRPVRRALSTTALVLAVFATVSLLLIWLLRTMKPASVVAAAAAASSGLGVAAAASQSAETVSSASMPGVSSFAVPVTFPTSAFDSYYVKPGPSVEPQPVVSDPVSGKVYPLNLTSPLSIPISNSDPIVYPVALANLSAPSTEAVVQAATNEILNILAANSSSSGLASNCSRCVAALSVGQMVARLAPTALPDAMIALCETTGFASNATCQSNYATNVFGAAWTQILAAADVTGLDGQYICASLSKTFCAKPAIRPVTAVFPKPRPASPKVPQRSGTRLKVLHMSDLHLDARYQVGSEGNCTSGMCCRPTSVNAAGADTLSIAAPLFGTYKCDSPYFLALAAMQAIGPLTGTSDKAPPAFSLYTGDLVAHDPANQLSHDYVEYVESSLWQIFKKYIGGPIYCALGNHDTAPDNLDAPHAIDDSGTEGRQFSWNYNHVSSLWQHYGWIDKQAAADAALHYGAYSVVDKHGVRIITINTDLYYKNNYYAFLHAADPDYSGIFSFLINELQKAEDIGQRAYVVGHVLTGWDGTNALPNSADLFYQIIDRYSPHVVASVFFGHTHEDQAFIYYRNNATNQTAEHAVANAWVGPSITPLTNLNSGFRMYEVDSGSFEVMDAYTFYADVDAFSDIATANATADGPIYQLEYSTREAYGAAANWPVDAPLNATFWHRVTEAVEADATNALASLINTYQGKSSVRSPNCTSDACAAAKVCYMRSGSSALGLACPQGFASVQSSFTGSNF